MTVQQLSYQLKTGKKFIDEALYTLVRQKKVLKRAFMKNTIVFFVPLIGQLCSTNDDGEGMREANSTLDKIIV